MLLISLICLLVGIVEIVKMNLLIGFILIVLWLVIGSIEIITNKQKELDKLIEMSLSVLKSRIEEIEEEDVGNEDKNA